MAYEADLCPGCGWPRTYSMHRESKGHWHATDGIRCQSCTVIEAKRTAVLKVTDRSPGALSFAARPDQGLAHAIADPILTFSAGGERASGREHQPSRDYSVITARPRNVSPSSRTSHDQV